MQSIDVRNSAPPPSTGVPSTVAPSVGAISAGAISGREGPLRYFNRELSWLQFNERVLEEALDATTPLLEQVFYLSIYGSNLDEFFMIRVSGLRRQMEAGVLESAPDGTSPSRQLAAIREQLVPSLRRSYDCWEQQIEPRLRREGIVVHRYHELNARQRELLRAYFKSEVFPVLTPLASDPGHPFPHISNLSINLAVVVRDPDAGERFARLKVPQSFPRLLRIPDEELALTTDRIGLASVSAPHFVWLEEVICANLDFLFPGMEVVAAHPFRVTRDADIDIEEDEAADLLLAMSEYVEQRQFGSAVRLEVDEEMPKRIQDTLLQNLRLAPYQVYQTPSPLGIADIAQLTKVERPDLKFPPFLPVIPPALATEESIFSLVSRRNVLLYHPYDSFQPVVSFIRQAAEDPDVLAIKQTLYRVGPNSPVVEALMRARENGKQVAVLVELKARFDEQNNIGWARALESTGVHVVYGVVGLKTHCKVCLVVRKERDGIKRYVHLATGNYNPITARAYSDIGLFTCNPEIAEDVSHLFNALTGISRKVDYNKLLVAPGTMREKLLQRIEREIAAHERHGDGHLAFKCNALTDRACITALYQASQAGVRVDLQVRSICCLRPGVPGLSENVRVTSLVGRFLEHVRIFYFRNGGDEEILVGSADLMGRNLDRRVEALFPVDDSYMRDAVRDHILFPHLRDEAKVRVLQSDGSYHRPGVSLEGALNSQERILAEGGGWRREAS